MTATTTNVLIGIMSAIVDTVVDSAEEEKTKGYLRYPEIEDKLKKGEEVFVDAHKFGDYVVSNYGVIKRKLMKGRLSKPLSNQNCKGNYKRVGLKIDRKNKQVFIHTLVLNSFYINPNPHKFSSTDHNDRNPANNNLRNLFFASKKYQRFNQKPYNNEEKSMKLSQKIRMMSKKGVFIREFESVTLAVKWIKENGHPKASNSRLINCANAKTSSAYSYKWEYVPVEDLPGEIWKQVPCDVMNSKAEGPYFASNFARIKNKRGKLIEGSKPAEGVYVKVCGKRRNRVIALTWCPNSDPINKIYVNHIDSNIHNDAPSNLEWVSQSENIQHAHNNGLINTKGAAVKVTCVETGNVITYKTLKALKDAIGVSHNAVKKYSASKKKMKKNGKEYLFEML